MHFILTSYPSDHFVISNDDMSLKYVHSVLGGFGTYETLLKWAREEKGEIIPTFLSQN